MPMGQIEKRLRALSEGKDLPWNKVVTLRRKSLQGIHKRQAAFDYTSA